MRPHRRLQGHLLERQPAVAPEVSLRSRLPRIHVEHLGKRALNVAQELSPGAVQIQWGLPLLPCSRR